MPYFGKIKAQELKKWINAYNEAGLSTEDSPPKEVIFLTEGCGVVVCSDLHRSLESAKALGIERIDMVDPLFREAGMPYCEVPVLTMAPNQWAFLFRLLWFFGFSANSESLTMARMRAVEAVGKLEQAAEESGSVLLVGHGFMNRFIAKELIKRGWNCKKRAGGNYWHHLFLTY